MASAVPPPASIAKSPSTTPDSLLRWYVFNNQPVPNSYRKADLLKLALDKGRKNNGVLKLLVDVDSCWERLIGCSKRDLPLAPWPAIHQHLQQLVQISSSSNLELIFMFNGTAIRPWAAPPPAFVLESTLLTLRSLGADCRATVDQHELELIKYAAKSNLHGIITCDAGLVTSDEALEVPIWCGLKFKGGGFHGGAQGQHWRGAPSLQSHELATAALLQHEAYKALTEIPPGDTQPRPRDRLLFLLRLLGDTSIGNELLQHFSSAGVRAQTLPPTLLEFIGKLPSLEAPVVEAQLKAVIPGADLKIMECLSKYKQGGAMPKKVKASGVKPQATAGTSKESPAPQEQLTPKMESLKLYCTVDQTDSRFPITPLLERLKEESEPEEEATSTAKSGTSGGAASTPEREQLLQRDIDNILSESPYQEPEGEEEGQEPEEEEEVEQEPQPQASSSSSNAPPVVAPLKTSRKVDLVAHSRHTAGLMHPAVLQLFRTNSLQLPPTGAPAPGGAKDPNSLFSLIRSKMYATLFNSNHMKFIGKPVDIKIKELSAPGGAEPAIAPAVDVGWQIPTVERLWLGDDCRPKRIRAFFSMSLSERQSLLNPDVVPQRVLVLVVALRYIVSREEAVLRRSELDAFLIQALLLAATDASTLTGGRAPPPPPRVLYLINLLGVALVHLNMLNDAVGAPIPYQLFIPSQFFDGALFAKILTQLRAQAPAEVCGASLVLRMERLRMAVLDGQRARFIENDSVDLQHGLGFGFRGLTGTVHGQVHGRGRAPAPPPLFRTQQPGFGRAQPQIPAQSIYGGVPGLLFNSVSGGAIDRRTAGSAAVGGPPRLSAPAGRGRSPYHSAAVQLHVAGQVVGEWGLPGLSRNGGGGMGMVSRQPAGGGGGFGFGLGPGPANWGRVSRNPDLNSVSRQPQQFRQAQGAKKKKKAKKPSTAAATTPSAAPTGPVHGQVVIKSKPTTPEHAPAGTAPSELQTQQPAEQIPLLSID